MKMEKVTVYAEKICHMHTCRKYAKYAAIAYSHKTDVPVWWMVGVRLGGQLRRCWFSARLFHSHVATGQVVHTQYTYASH